MIETELWKKHPEKPGIVIFDQQRVAQDIFNELIVHLKADGRMPDEYLLLNHNWQDGKLFPRDADIISSANFGGNEGIYLDVSVRYRKEVSEYNKTTNTVEQKEREVAERFATGKTLGDTVEDLDRMSLVASSVTAAFYGMKREVLERYSQIESGEVARQYPRPSYTEQETKASPPQANNMDLVAKNHPQRDNPKFMELAQRIDKNFSDYQKSLYGFGVVEITDNASRIKAMVDAHSYMVFYHNFCDYELAFYLQFQNPLEIVGDILTERNRDVGDVSDILEYVKGHQDDYLGDYPLLDGVAPADKA